MHIGVGLDLGMRGALASREWDNEENCENR
jgi:hypothetical protein